jgi:tetratricopeptide (TPR) repeat protein
MPEILVLAAGLLVAGAFVLRPLWREAPAVAAADEGGAIRHRVALEALRDVEADHAAGLTDGATYVAQLAEAEAQAATTGDLGPPSPSPARTSRASSGRSGAIAAASLIGLILLAGSAVPGTGMANATVVNQSLADARAAEDARQTRIGDLLDEVAADPSDAEALSDLADAYLAGSTADDLIRAAAALQLLINADPDRADAYERLMTAYLRAADHANARAVHDSYAELASANPAEAAFFDGIIALRGEDDPERALAAFDRFLELAPDDPRAAMVEGLRDEAAGARSP